MWPLTRKSPDTAEQAAVAALRLQTATLVKRCAEADVELSSVIEGEISLLMLFGFVDYYFIKHGIKNRKQRVSLARNVFREVFGSVQGIRMIGLLEGTLRRTDSLSLCREGFNAAREFENSGLQLLEIFFESEPR